VLLLVPFDLVEYKEDGNNSSIVMIPMTAPVNCRDVSLTRINDETEDKYLKLSPAHAIFGRKGSKQEGYKHKMKPIFNGTAEYEGENPLFSTKLDFDSVKTKIFKFLNVLNNSSPNRQSFCVNNIDSSSLEVVSQADTNVGTTSLLYFFLTTLDEAYNNFNTYESYCMLNAATCTAMMECGMDTENLLYSETLQLPMVVRAMAHFQIFMSPVILSLADGNHRSMRVLLGMLGCSKESVVAVHIPGFKLSPNITNVFASASNPLITYNFFDINDARKSSCDYSIEELQCLSYNMSDRLEKSRSAGSCFR
jgi:hypothetical protein